MRRVCFVMHNIGDYHAARIVACGEALEAQGDKVFTIQASQRSAFYHHRPSRVQQLIARIDHTSLEKGGRDWSVLQLWEALSRADASYLFTIGYSDRLALATLAYAKATGTPIFFMADSKDDDQQRGGISQFVKRRVVRRFDGALVAGAKHRRYFRSLGVPGPIELGYDVIDNAFFRARAQRFERKLSLVRKLGLLPERYVLAVSRFVDRKRIDLVLKIFAESGAPELGYRLVLIGTGPTESAVHEQIQAMGLAGKVVHLREIKNTSMALFYRSAHALILASDFDQWGLCVNEAMALGIPCIVTDRCGVAGEMVHDGETGFVFPWGTTQKAASDLRMLLQDPALLTRISQSAGAMSDNWGLERFVISVSRLIGPAGASSE